MKPAWWNWPYDPMQGRVAWWHIAWRLLWLPVLVTGIALYLLAILMAYGPKRMKYEARKLL